MPNVLLVSPDRVAPEMAGPGIRYVELGRVIGRSHHVCLAAPAGSEPVDGGPELEPYDPDRRGSLKHLIAAADIVVAPPLAPALIGSVEALQRGWIVDFYNAEPFEGLALARTSGLRERLLDHIRIDRLAYAARAGDGFVCANERQRDMWLGFLAANHRLESTQYRCDPELRRLIDIVAFGVPSERPTRRADALRGTVFPRDAKIMVWNGGVWDWLDPDTVLAALVLLRERDPSWHLAFSGTGRPGDRPAMQASVRLHDLVDRLGLRAEHAVDIREWTPYAERADALLDADMGVSAHHASVEARFAHRARMLDLVWSRTPILCSEGDEWGEIIAAEGLGEAVPPRKPEALAEAAVRIAERGRDSYADALEAAASARTWDAVAAPLLSLLDAVAVRRRRPLGVVGRGVALRHSAAFTFNRCFAGLARARRLRGDTDVATHRRRRP